MSVVNAKCPFAVRNNINRARNGNHRTRFPRKFLCKCNRLRQIFLRNLVRDIRIYALCAACAQSQCLDFGDIPTQNRKMDILQQCLGGILLGALRKTGILKTAAVR